jgi:hypothetical protein
MTRKAEAMFAKPTSSKQKIRVGRFLVWSTIVTLLACSPASPALADADEGNPNVVPPRSKVGGLTYGEWAGAWWQWLLPIPPCSTGVNPADPTQCAGTPAPNLDLTGAQCGVNQPAFGQDKVWFLAGTAYPTSVFGPPTRSCTVPADTHTFFPIINVIDDWPCPAAFNFNPPPGRSLEDFLTNDADTITNGVTALNVEVDGVAIKNPFKYRATSRLVGFTADPGWVFNDPCILEKQQVGVADGYWIMLRPLSKGHHTLHFRGVNTLFNPPFETEVTYHLTIGP